MRNHTSRKLKMAGKVHDLAKAKSPGTVVYVEALGRLEGGLTRAGEVETAYRTARNDVKAATIRKKELRSHIRAEYIVPMARFAEAASTQDPDLAAHFKLPLHSASNAKFVAAARTLIGEAGSRQALFTSFGMPENFLADFAAKLDEFVRTSEEQDRRQVASVAATAEMEGLMVEVMALIKTLDAMQRYRFRDNPGELAAWESARNVAWPDPPAEKKEPAA